MIGGRGDILCPDYKRAEQNRKMVEEGQNIEGYLAVEYALEGLSIAAPIPDWIPVGNSTVQNDKGNERKEYE